jgi:hypothetical protein
VNSSTTEDPIILSAARWFWWIAALSLVNTVLYFSGSNTSFVVGLGMTAVVSVVFSSQAVIAVVLVALLLGFYFLMGLFAQREKAWAFYLGLALYGIDALIYIRFEDWMSAAFHGYAIFCIVRGVMRLRELRELRAQPAPVLDKAEASV